MKHSTIKNWKTYLNTYKKHADCTYIIDGVKIKSRVLKWELKESIPTPAKIKYTRKNWKRKKATKIVVMVKSKMKKKKKRDMAPRWGRKICGKNTV